VLAGPARALYAYFHFAALPRSTTSLEVGGIRPTHASARRVEVVQSAVESSRIAATVLSKGLWRVELRLAGTVLRRLEIDVGG
jgi:hypothetical protein